MQAAAPPRHSATPQLERIRSPSERFRNTERLSRRRKQGARAAQLALWATTARFRRSSYHHRRPSLRTRQVPASPSRRSLLTSRAVPAQRKQSPLPFLPIRQEDFGLPQRNPQDQRRRQPL